MDLLKLTALELGRKIKAGEVTVREAVRAVIEQAKEVEPTINSYVTLDEEGAYAQADEIQKKIDAGELTGPLAGVPVAIKDNMCIEGQLTTCSSKILSGFKPTYTAQAVENLKNAGAVILGKTNMDEFAMGSTTETSYMDQRKTLIIQLMFREVLPVDPVRQWLRANVIMHLVLIPVDRSVSQVPFAE